MSTTEARLAEAFADGALITACRAAWVLGIDEKTLKVLADGGAIRAVPVGKQRRYTEAGLRSYLNGETEFQCQSTKRRARPTGISISLSKGVGFTEARALRLSARR